jgi:hypothetical protein
MSLLILCGMIALKIFCGSINLFTLKYLNNIGLNN